jgi:hypothetical protein
MPVQRRLWLLAEFTGILLFVVALQIADARGLNAAGSHLRYDAWHHLYLGVALFAASYAGAERWRTASLVVRACGLACTVDDAFQHLVQALTGDLAFRSPMHLAYAVAYERWEWVRTISHWLDGRFGT